MPYSRSYTVVGLLHSFYSIYTCIQGTSTATDMSEENFVSFSADLTEQEYFNFSVSGKQHASLMPLNPSP